MSKEKNIANQKSDWLSQVYEVQDKDAAQINGGASTAVMGSALADLTTSIEQQQIQQQQEFQRLRVLAEIEQQLLNSSKTISNTTKISA